MNLRQSVKGDTEMQGSRRKYLMPSLKPSLNLMCVRIIKMHMTMLHSRELCTRLGEIQDRISKKQA